MAEVILSPGVFQIESDQSLYTQAPQVLGAAIVGPTVGGIPYVPTYVTTYSQYLSIFGDIFKSGSYYYEYFTSLAAKDYFSNGGQTLLVTRIISGSGNASTYASSNVNNGGAFASSSVSLVNFVADGRSFIVTGSSDGVTSGSYGTFYYTSSTAQVDGVPANTYYIVTQSVNATTSSIISQVITKLSSLSNTFGILGTRGDGNNINVTSTYAGVLGNGFKFSGSAFGGGSGTTVSSFALETLDWGDQMNNAGTEVSGALASGSAYNVRWEVTNSDSTNGTFTIIVRRGDDNINQKNILETWANLSLDPQLPNYVSRVIGDLKPVYNGTAVNYTGTYPNASKYVRVKSVTTPNADSLDNNGAFKTSTYGSTLPSVGSGSFSGGVAATNASQSMNENVTANNIQGFAPADYNAAFTLLSNRDEYQFNVLMAPGVGLDCPAASSMIATVEGRGDAIAITGAGVYGTSITQATTTAAGFSSNYAATYYPWVQLYSANLGKAVWCPPSTVMGGVLAFNDQVGAEWFAPAGLNRGGIPSVIMAEKRLSQTDRDTLYTKNVNPLATFPGTGVCVWGQKTLQRKPTALDRVNVRRLLIALKGFIGGVARNLVFEQNTTVTRNRFLSQVNPYLSSVVSRQGLYAYKVIMDDTNNTPDVVDRNQLVGQIYIQPTKTAEFIILNFNILPTGATFPA
jgi:phage tail sheath protein FI